MLLPKRTHLFRTTSYFLQTNKNELNNLKKKENSRKQRQQIINAYELYITSYQILNKLL